MHGPAHPIGQLTTTELRNYRRELEHAIKTLKTAPVVAELQTRLDEVAAEERSRAEVRQSVSGIDPEARLMQHHSE